LASISASSWFAAWRRRTSLYFNNNKFVLLTPSSSSSPSFLHPFPPLDTPLTLSFSFFPFPLPLPSTPYSLTHLLTSPFPSLLHSIALPSSLFHPSSLSFRLLRHAPTLSYIPTLTPSSASLLYPPPSALLFLYSFPPLLPPPTSSVHNPSLPSSNLPIHPPFPPPHLPTTLLPPPW